MVTSMPAGKLACSSPSWWPRDETSTEADDNSAARSREDVWSGPVTPTSRSRRRATARDHVGLVIEPQAAIFPDNAIGGFEIAAIANDFGEPDILDLRDIDRSVPGREQRRGADRPADL